MQNNMTLPINIKHRYIPSDSTAFPQQVDPRQRSRSPSETGRGDVTPASKLQADALTSMQVYLDIGLVAQTQYSVNKL